MLTPQLSMKSRTFINAKAPAPRKTLSIYMAQNTSERAQCGNRNKTNTIPPYLPKLEPL